MSEQNRHKFPFLTFQFKVDIGNSNENIDTFFQEISGISAELQFDTINQGGNNHAQLNLPTRTKYSNLVLKKGTLSTKSDLLDWCMNAITNDFVKSEIKNVTVHLVDEKMTEVFTWEFDSCYPVKWEISSFNAQKSEIAMETIELTYKSFRVVK